MKKKDFLNEIMGVPKSIESWVDYFTILLTGMAEGVIRKEEIEEAGITYTDNKGNTVEGIAYRGESNMSGNDVMKWVIKIGGFDDMKDLLSDANFKSFPLYNPNIALTLIFLPDELWERQIGSKKSYSMNAAHGWNPKDTKISKLGGNNLVFTNQYFKFDGMLPISWMDNFDQNRFKRMIKTSISHELTHAFESYMRLKQTGTPFSGRETFLNIITGMMSDDRYPQWKSFLHLVYLHLSFEINARITQLYYEMKENDVSTKEEFMNVLKGSSVWEEIKLLEDFDADKFMNSFTHEKTEDFDEIMINLGRRLKQLPPIHSIDSPKESMIHLINGWNTTLQHLNKMFKKEGDYKGKLMDLVPEKALKDPKVFFKFFEKRFHKKGEEFRRKALRLSSVVLDEKNN